MRGDPDVTVIGSPNGLGKTSLLEACALICVRAALGSAAAAQLFGARLRARPDAEELLAVLVRAGQPVASVEAELRQGGLAQCVTAALDSHGGALVMHPIQPLPLGGRGRVVDPDAVPADFWDRLLGFSADPLLLPPVLYFHSQRRVAAGATPLSTLLNQGGAVGAFKGAVLQALFAGAQLLEPTLAPADQGAKLDRLNDLVARYAGGRIERLRPVASDSAVELLIAPLDGGPAYPLDALSSGQKEIIATLFLVWLHTRAEPGIVLIDEPELYLNAEWHAWFVREVLALAPHNQYIIATHSPFVYDSVEPDRRFLLTPGGGV
jgi:hypothetical protein